MDQQDLSGIGFTCTPDEQVMRLALLAKRADLDGVVCSTMEASILREKFGRDFCLVTPGIRPVGSALDDQRRIASPQTAINSGSDYLVIGRPITAADNPAEMLTSIVDSLSTVDNKISQSSVEI